MKTRTGRKIVPAIIASALLVSSFAGCSRSGARGTAETISADDPWFNVNTVELGAEEDTTEYEYFDMSVMGTVGDDIVVQVSGQRMMPEDFDYENDSYLDYSLSEIRVYGADGTLKQTHDIVDIMRQAGFDPENDGWGSSSIAGNSVVMDVYEYDANWNETRYTCVFDLESGEIVNVSENQSDSGEGAGNLSNEGTTQIQGYAITKYWISEEPYSYIINVVDPSGNSTDIDLREELPGVEIYDIRNFYYVGNNKVYFNYADTSFEDESFLCLDLTDYSITEVDPSELEWLDMNLIWGISYVDGIGNVTSDTEGVKLIDFENNQITDLVDFNNSNINRYMANDLQLVAGDVETGKYVFVGRMWEESGNYGYSSSTYIVTFTKADSNPNAGKTVIKVADLEGLSRSVCEALCRFNDQSEDYFIRIDDRYDYQNFMDQESVGDDTDWEQLELTTKASLSNQLMMDILSGEGPDIILGALSYSQLNNPDYLIDITDMIPGEGYFSNAFDICMVGGKLYQMPLNCGVQGIATDRSNVSDGQVGFTFDQYAEFVDTVCNGNDPMQMDKLDFFCLCYSTMTDQFETADGNVDYDNEAFRALAEYVNDNVVYIEPDYDDEDYYVSWGYGGMDIDEGSNAATTVYFTSFSNYLDTFGGRASEKAVLGVPSCDGRGPSIQIDDSVAISACTPSEEGCRSFLSMLLGEDLQYMFATNGSTPLNIAAFERYASDRIESYNNQIQMMLRYYTEAEMTMYGMNCELADESAITEYENLIASCDNIRSIDPSVVSIIREEMPAYFEGQKSLDDVITILADRVRTFVNERG